MATLRVRISSPARHEYFAPAPGKARNRWGCYRRGYPVRHTGRLAVFIRLVPLPAGPAGVHARNFARAYGRDALIAHRSPSGTWYTVRVSFGDISPPPAGAEYDGPATLTIEGYTGE